MRQMVLVGFLQAQNCTIFASSWRHPLSRADFTSAEYYRRSAGCWRTANSTSAFSTIGWRCRTCYGGDHAQIVANGIRCVKMDPVATLMPWAWAPKHLGIGATGSTTYYEPFDVARASRRSTR